jgi:hypothetical protein
LGADRLQFDLLVHLEVIDAFAFADNLIERIRIPASVTTIGMRAFSGCSKLSTVEVKEGSRLSSIGERLFVGTARSIECILPECELLLSIGLRAFAECLIVRIKIPVFVELLGIEAFLGCINLSVVEIPVKSKLIYISENCFKGCVMLGRFVVSEQVADIADTAFIGCTNLKILSFRSNPVVRTASTLGFRAMD